ncbi:MAG: aminotransferase class V-fold PLP-dependent enzyme [Alphaproteobacteria bacterium]|nr:aminotransferase class V-fold PLP-dependent enzyme [Alphaproteobacteria bacterium]
MKKNIYMDSAASWLKPDSVIKAQVDFLTNYYANAGRGICARAGHVDDLIADSRRIVADFIGAEPENIVFVSGATDALNRVVNILTTQPGYSDLSNFAVSDLDHHSARLPWENLWHDAKIRKKFVCDLDENLNIDVNSIPKTDYLTITAMSNVLGVKQDVASIIKVAKQKNPNVITIVDASQYVVHEKINVKEWDCDFLAFSGHKIGADTGIGVLYIKEPDKYFPDKFGGGMINKIIDSEESSQWIYNKVPEKFEAGTLPLTQIVGLKYAIMELEKWNGGKDLINYMYSELSKIPNIKLITSKDACMISFVVKNMHVIDFGALIGTNNICVRVGNMCASWIHKKLNIDGSVRLSVGPWNTMDECEYVINTIKELVK